MFGSNRHSVKYATYINSAAWQRRREAALRRAGHRCEGADPFYDYKEGGTESGPRCEAKHGLHVHHLTYENLGNEPGEDLQVLCPRHHAIAELMLVTCDFCTEQCTYDEFDAVAAWEEACRNDPGLSWADRLDAARASMSEYHDCPFLHALEKDD